MVGDDEFSVPNTLIQQAAELAAVNPRGFILIVVDENDSAVWSAHGAGTLELLGALATVASELIAEGDEDDDAEDDDAELQ